MPTTDQHITQALENYELLSAFNYQFPMRKEWMITMQFYCLLHLTKACLRNVGVLETQIKDHRSIRLQFAQLEYQAYPFAIQTVKYDNRKKPLTYLTVYLELENLSKRARYLGLYGGYHPIQEVDWLDALDATDVLLAHFLQNHPQISQAPFQALTTLPTITFQVNTPIRLTAFISRSGLIKM